MQFIAHRGACGYAPENTLAAFANAVRMDVDMIELDVYKLKTGELIVLHDQTVDRTTNGTGYVWDYSFEEIRQLDAGNGEKVPLLSEVLDLVDRRIPINIELKGIGTGQPVAELVRHYIDVLEWNPALFYVSAGDHYELGLFSQCLPSIRTGALYTYFEVPSPEAIAAFAAKPGAYSINVDAITANHRLVEQAHAYGLKVYAWNVFSQATAAKMRRIKVDGIFTDYPDKIGPPRRKLARARFSRLMPRLQHT